MAEYVTATRGGVRGGVPGSLQFAGAVPLPMVGLGSWPAGTPVQLHYSVGDPFRDQSWVDPFLESVKASGSPVEAFLDYPIDGHLFTDSSLEREYDEASSTLAFGRALEFLARVGSTAR